MKNILDNVSFLKIKALFKKECVLIIAIILAIITSFFSMPKLSYINFKVLILLFNLMIVIGAFRKLKILDALALFVLKKNNNIRQITLSLVLITFFTSMIATNDVSLLTFVPLTIIIGEKCNIDVMKIVILETIAANIGSSLTPMGNPQNLYIYASYDVNIFKFLSITAPLVFVGLIFIIAAIYKLKNNDISIDLESIHIKDKKRMYIYSFLLIVILLSVFNIIDYRIAFLVTVFVVCILDRVLFLKVDYSLICTFIAFFIFVGNISNMQIIRGFMELLLHNKSSVYIFSILFSQFISNVPACMLISGFTENYSEMLMGVNIGGLGTIVASLASLISYKLYVESTTSNNKSKEYMKEFSIYNFVLLCLLGFIFFFVRL